MNEQIEKHPLTDLSETFVPLRLANTKAPLAMNRSLEVHGQGTLITCLRSVMGLEVIEDTLPKTQQDENLIQETIDTTRKVLVLHQKLFDDPVPCPFSGGASLDFLDEEVF